MNDSPSIPTIEGIITLYAVPVKTESNPELRNSNEEVVLPKYQNRIAAEVTSDMFMAGLMCE